MCVGHNTHVYSYGLVVFLESGSNSCYVIVFVKYSLETSNLSKSSTALDEKPLIGAKDFDSLLVDLAKFKTETR